MTEPRPAALDRLTGRQREVLTGWLPDVAVVADHSWGLLDTVVLEVIAAGRRLIVKAEGADGKHFARELRAHREWLGPWRAIGRAAELLHADEQTRLLVTEHLPGRLVLGDPAQDRPGTFRRAGRLLALMHAQHAETDDGYEASERDKTLMLLDRTHRIAPDVVDALRADIAGWDTPSVAVVPTHGDWQPRNWLVDDEGVVRVIDMGRAALRPAMTDLARLAAQDFRTRPELEAAFLEGYGPDPRTPAAWRASGPPHRAARPRPPSEPDQASNTPAIESPIVQGQELDPRTPAAWHRLLVREAVGTAVWAHEVGNEAFEAQGHRMIADVLGDGRG